MRYKNIMGWLFASPYLIFLVIFFLIPLIWALWLSSTDWNLIAPEHNFVGFSNYIDAIFCRRVRNAFIGTFRFMGIIVVIVFICSLTIALILHNLPDKLKPIFSVGFFTAYLSSGVAMAVVVRGIVAFSSPISIWVRDTFDITIHWLRNPLLATLVISLMIIWKMTGYYSLLLLSGLENIGDDVHDAAKIDGCEGFSKFFHITLPLIYPASFTVVILAVGLSFGIFTEPFQLTGGGPGGATMTWQLEIFHQAFVRLEAGYASAVAIIAAVVTFSTVYSVKILLEKWGARYDW